MKYYYSYKLIAELTKKKKKHCSGRVYIALTGKIDGRFYQLGVEQKEIESSREKQRSLGIIINGISFEI